MIATAEGVGCLFLFRWRGSEIRNITPLVQSESLSVPNFSHHFARLSRLACQQAGAADGRSPFKTRISLKSISTFPPALPQVLAEKVANQKKLPISEKLSGWKTGFEPATSGTTIQRSNQLSYNHHFNRMQM